MSLDNKRFLALLDFFSKSDFVFDGQNRAVAQQNIVAIKELCGSFQGLLKSGLDSRNNQRPIESYQTIASCLALVKISIYAFRLCLLDVSQNQERHTKQSLLIYTEGRELLRFAILLLKQVFPTDQTYTYTQISQNMERLSVYNYSRQIMYAEYCKQSLDLLFSLQAGTRYVMLNWDLRLEMFQLKMNSINYKQLAQRKITDPHFNEKMKLITILNEDYLELLADLKKSYELNKQEFFTKKMLLVLEEYKKFLSFFGERDKLESVNQQIAVLQRHIFREGKTTYAR